eukprot:UN05260
MFEPTKENVKMTNKIHFCCLLSTILSMLALWVQFYFQFQSYGWSIRTVSSSLVFN